MTMKNKVKLRNKKNQENTKGLRRELLNKIRIKCPQKRIDI
jgi:hypothetical protein